MVATTPMASRRMLDVWSPEYSAVALPSRWRAAPAKKSMLSTLPGTSNSVASRTGLPVWLTSSATRSSACSPASAASLASTADRSAGVAVAQPGRAARADPVHVGGSRQRVVGDGLTGRGVDHLMQAATGDHRGTVDPATCHAGGNGRSHDPTLTDDERRSYAFLQRQALQTRDFMAMVAC